MLTLTLSEVNELKTSAEKQFGIKIHFHDCCGGQSFSADSITPEAQTFISTYFEKKGLRAEFSDDMRAFVVREAQSC
ncbi:MAG: hypothetical protein U0L92_03595 [Clostridia bacterium]|nr:hypothetical protein [Clostridia bacterium]